MSTTTTHCSSDGFEIHVYDSGDVFVLVNIHGCATDGVGAALCADDLYGR